MKGIILCLCLVVGAVVADETLPKRFDGDKVLRMYPNGNDHHEMLRDLLFNSDREHFDFWTEPSGINNAPVDLHVNKDIFPAFAAKLQAASLNYTIGVHDLQQLIDETNAANELYRVRRDISSRRRKTGRNSKSTRASIVNTFARHADIVSYLNSMCSAYPSIASCGSIGTSYENRELRYIRLGTTGSSKKEIIIEAGIHAREWLAPATIISIIDRLLTTYSSDGTAKRLLDTYYFYILPSANPDGYEYSQNDRTWRKTRSKNTGSVCVGTDPNRNYDIYWSTSGSSSSPCSDIYHGSKAFSEPETKAFSDFLKAHKNNAIALFCVHTYSQMWLIPYANKKGNYAPNYNEMLRVANIGANALMAVNSKKWDVGNTVDVLSAAAGGTDDYGTSIGIPYSYTLELRPASTAVNGFVVKESEIDPSAKEVYAGLVAAVDAMQK